MESFKRILVLSAIFVLLLAGMTGCHSNKGAGQLEFEPLDSQFALLERVYPVWFGEKTDVLSDETGVRVVCEFLTYKGMVASDAEKWGESLEKFNADEMDYVVGNTIKSDYWLSLAAFDYLEAFYNGDSAGKAEIASKCAAMDPEFESHMTSEVQSFRQIADAEGFLDAEGKIRADKRNVVLLLHRYQWVGVAGNQLPLARIQPPEEMLAVFRWQIEQSHMPFEKKLSRIERFRHKYHYDYDYDYARAVLFSKNGINAEACRILHEGLSHLSPDDTYRKARYEQGIKLLSQHDPSACKL